MGTPRTGPEPAYSDQFGVIWKPNQVYSMHYFGSGMLCPFFNMFYMFICCSGMLFLFVTGTRHPLWSPHLFIYIYILFGLPKKYNPYSKQPKAPPAQFNKLVNFTLHINMSCPVPYLTTHYKLSWIIPIEFDELM